MLQGASASAGYMRACILHACTERKGHQAHTRSFSNRPPFPVQSTMPCSRQLRRMCSLMCGPTSTH